MLFGRTIWFLVATLVCTGCLNQKAPNETESDLASANVALGGLRQELLSGITTIQASFETSKDRILFENGAVTASVPQGSRVSVTLHNNAQLKIAVVSASGQGQSGILLQPKAPLPRVWVQGIDYNITSMHFSARTSPAWTNAIANVANPFLNSFLKPRLPNSLHQIAKSFQLSNPQKLLEDVQRIFLHDVKSPDKGHISNISGAMTIRIPRTVTAALGDNKAKLEGGGIVNVKVETTGKLDNHHIGRVYLWANPFSISLMDGSLGSAAAIGKVSLNSFEFLQGGNVIVNLNTLITSPFTFRYKYRGGKFVVDGNRATGINAIVQDKCGQMLPEMLAIVRTQDKLIPGYSIEQMLGLR